MLKKSGADIVVEPASSIALGSPHSAVVSDLLALPNGGFTVLWTTRDLDQDNPATDFKLRSFGIAGAAETTVFHAPQLLTARGSLVLSSPTTVGLFSTAGSTTFREFRAVGGAPIDGPDAIFPNSAIQPTLGDAVATSGGKMLMTYRAQVNGVDQLFARAVSASNGLGAPTMIGATATPQYSPHMERLANGNVVIGFETVSATDNGDIRAFVVGEAGRRVAGPVVVNQKIAGQQVDNDVAALTSGGFVMTWTDRTNVTATGDDIRARVFNDAGQAISAEFRVNTGLAGNQNNAAVSQLTGGRFAVVWESDAVGEGQIVAQVFDRFGSKIGGEVVIQTSVRNNWYQSPVVEMLSDGRLLIGMTNDKREEGVVARIYDPGKIGTAAADVLTGAVLGRVIDGLGGNDKITGTALADRLDGGAGRDTLTGAAGKDVFVFSVSPTAANVDTIKDFKPVDDTIALENSIFRAFGAKVDAAELVANADGLAKDANDFLIYEKDTGELYYDSNGSAAGGSLLVAMLPKNLVLTAADFTLI